MRFLTKLALICCLSSGAAAFGLDYKIDGDDCVAARKKAGCTGGEDLVIEQLGKKFSHKGKEIKKLETAACACLIFVNNEKDNKQSHNAYSLGKANPFKIKKQPFKKDAPYHASVAVMAKAGETLIECAIHSNMKLTSVVK